MIDCGIVLKEVPLTSGSETVSRLHSRVDYESNAIFTPLIIAERKTARLSNEGIGKTINNNNIL